MESRVGSPKRWQLRLQDLIVFKHEIYNFFTVIFSHTNISQGFNQKIPHSTSSLTYLINLFKVVIKTLYIWMFCDVSNAFDRIWHNGLLFKFGQHYENMPIQIYRKFHLQKLKILSSDIFHISAQNIDCGYS